MNKEELKIDEWLELVKEDKNLKGAYICFAQYMYLLEQENNQLKLDFELYKDNHIYKNYEVERKDIIIKELRSWLKDFADYSDCIKIISVLNKLNELEGKNESKRDV